MRNADPAAFEPANYGSTYGTILGYTPSAIWTWLVYRKDVPGIIAYNDV